MAAYTTGLTKIYDPSDRPALDNVNVAFRAGELCAIMGPPGAGKSTLLACLAGHEPPSVGKVYVGRGDARPWLPQQVRQICRGEVGFVLSHSRPFPGRTVLENLEWAAALAGRPDDIARAERVAGILGLLDDLHTPAGQLPADLQHLTMCAAALLPDPSVLLVDESDTGPLGASTLAVLRRCTAELGTTVVAVTESPEAAALADRVVFLATGRVAGIITRPAEDVVHELREIFAGRHASRSYVPEQGGPPSPSSPSADPGPPERHPADA